MFALRVQCCFPNDIRIVLTSGTLTVRNQRNVRKSQVFLNRAQAIHYEKPKVSHPVIGHKKNIINIGVGSVVRFMPHHDVRKNRPQKGLIGIGHVLLFRHALAPFDIQTQLNQYVLRPNQYNAQFSFCHRIGRIIRTHTELPRISNHTAVFAPYTCQRRIISDHFVKPVTNGFRSNLGRQIRLLDSTFLKFGYNGLIKRVIQPACRAILVIASSRDFASAKALVAFCCMQYLP